MRTRKLLRKTAFLMIILIALINLLAILHAYRFTHFDRSAVRTAKPEQLSVGEKITTLLTGPDNPRPINRCTPSGAYHTFTVNGDTRLECWKMECNDHKGTVILYHGYGGEKSGMLDKAHVFLEQGYDVVLVDFGGAGNSEGNRTSIGYYEATQVKCVTEHVASTGEKNIILFGTSMGAVAILKSMHDYKLPVSGIILECPFSTMLKTVAARFNTMKVPSFPLANLLVFWGGVLNGFNAFAHNPVDYARAVDVPVLLMSGARDRNVPVDEIRQIYNNLSCSKQLVIYPDAGHENYLIKHRNEWTTDISSFLHSLEK